MPLYFFFSQGRKCGSMVSSHALRSPSPMAILGDTGRGDCVTDQGARAPQKLHQEKPFKQSICMYYSDPFHWRKLHEGVVQGRLPLFNISYAVPTSVSGEESGWLQRASGPILGSSPSLTCSLMRGGFVVSDITVQPTVASVASPEKPDLSPEQVSLDSYRLPDICYSLCICRPPTPATNL